MDDNAGIRLIFINKYKRARVWAQRVLKEARRKSFVFSISAQTPMSHVWKRVHKMSGKFSSSPVPVFNKDGETVTDGIAMAYNTLARIFVDVSRRASRPPVLRRIPEIEEGHELHFLSFGSESYNIPFTSEGSAHSSFPLRQLVSWT